MNVPVSEYGTAIVDSVVDTITEAVADGGTVIGADHDHVLFLVSEPLHV